MKVFAISDLHLSINSNKPMNIFGPVWENYLQDIEASWKSNVSDNDIVLIPGDISWAMKLSDAVADLNYINQFKGTKIILRGNHDYWWSSLTALNDVMPKGMHAIQNNALKFGNIIFCGSRGWTVPDGNQHKTPEDEKIYKREVIRLELSLQQAAQLKTSPNDQLIALMHYPPYNYKYENSEFTDLLEKYGVQKVVYGHLHNDFSQNLFLHKNGIDYFLTSCDLVGNKLTFITSDENQGV